jgi:hypothetical protein
MSDRIERLTQNGTAAFTVRQRTNRNSADERAVGGDFRLDLVPAGRGVGSRW